MPKPIKYLNALKPVDIEVYPVDDAHPIVKDMHDLALKYRSLVSKLEEIRKEHKPPRPVYDMTCHFVASNEFYFLLRLGNTEEIEKYVRYWTKGPSVNEVIHSVTYHAVVYGENVSLFSTNKGLPILRAPMHIIRSQYERFIITKNPYASWILDNALPRIQSGVDYSEELENEQSSTM